MSQAEIEASSCHGKEKLTGERARQIAKQMGNRRKSKSKANVTAYRCHICRAYHVGGRKF
jgi:hypothetical protein